MFAFTALNQPKIPQPEGASDRRQDHDGADRDRLPVAPIANLAVGNRVDAPRHAENGHYGCDPYSWPRQHCFGECFEYSPHTYIPRHIAQAKTMPVPVIKVNEAVLIISILLLGLIALSAAVGLQRVERAEQIAARV